MEILANSRLDTTKWQEIQPNEDGDWINQRSKTFPALRPLVSGGADNGLAPIFLMDASAFLTRRDAWCYNSSYTKLVRNIQQTVDFYNEQVDAFARTRPIGRATEKKALAKAFVGKTPTQFHWLDENYRDVVAAREYAVNEQAFTVAMYRPFFKQRTYSDSSLVSRVGKFPQIYPTPESKNLGIAVTGTGVSSSFHTLITDSIVDDGFTGHSAYYPRWRYLPSENALGDASELEQVRNINPAAVSQYRERYGDPSIGEDDLFHHVYGLLHSQQWRDAFAVDLARLPARIPMAASLVDFHAFADAGRELAKLHVGYETVKPYPLDVQVALGWNLNRTDAYRVTRMAYPRVKKATDKSRIKYNAGITLAGIPDEAHEYLLGNRSALDWLLNRYQARTHKASGIVNDPNDWADEVGDPRYILDLVMRVTTVSVETVRIVRGLPELPI